MSQPQRPESTRRHRGRLLVRRADVRDVLEVVERVYEAVCLLADEGIVEFDVLDLRPAIATLRWLMRECGE